MARQRFDIGSKWLLQRQGKGVLSLGGLNDVRRYEAMPGEIIQNRRFPDGLLKVFLGNDEEPHHVLTEIATFPERRALKQALDNLALAYSALGHLPELIMLVLRPKGRFRITGHHSIQSKLGLSRLDVTWKTVELWTLSAEQFLAEGDVGMMPWVPLMRIDGSPEPVLARCARRIEREARPQDRTDLLVVSQVMTQLRFGVPDLLNFFGGRQTMLLESPIIQEIMARGSHELILDLIKDRFGPVSRPVAKQLRAVIDEKKLRQLNRLAAKCPDLQTFCDAARSAKLPPLVPGLRPFPGGMIIERGEFLNAASRYPLLSSRTSSACSIFSRRGSGSTPLAPSPRPMRSRMPARSSSRLRASRKNWSSARAAGKGDIGERGMRNAVCGMKTAIPGSWVTKSEPLRRGSRENSGCRCGNLPNRA